MHQKQYFTQVGWLQISLFLREENLFYRKLEKHCLKLRVQFSPKQGNGRQVFYNDIDLS